MDRDASSASSPFLEAGLPRGRARSAGILLHGRDRTREEKVVLASSFHTRGDPLAGSRRGHRELASRPLFLIPSPSTSLSVPSHRSYRPRGRRSRGRGQAGAQPDLFGRLLAGCVPRSGICLAASRALGRAGGLHRQHLRRAGGSPGAFPPDLLAGLRVLVTGSDSDEWIPEASTRETARLLSELGAEVRLRVYKGRPHIVSPEELAEARDFIRALAA